MLPFRSLLFAFALLSLATSTPLPSEDTRIPILPDEHFIRRHSATDPRANAVIEHWTPDRIADARPFAQQALRVRDRWSERRLVARARPRDDPGGHERQAARERKAGGGEDQKVVVARVFAFAS